MVTRDRATCPRSGPTPTRSTRSSATWSRTRCGTATGRSPSRVAPFAGGAAVMRRGRGRGHPAGDGGPGLHPLLARQPRPRHRPGALHRQGPGRGPRRQRRGRLGAAGGGARFRFVLPGRNSAARALADQLGCPLLRPTHWSTVSAPDYDPKQVAPARRLPSSTLPGRRARRPSRRRRTSTQLAAARTAHLGGSAHVNLANREIGVLPPAAKGDAGKRVNELRRALEAAFDARARRRWRTSATPGSWSRSGSTCRCCPARS